jgi:hypothetical protein
MPDSEHLTLIPDEHLAQIRDDVAAVLSKYFESGEVQLAQEDAFTADGRTVSPWTFKGVDSIGVDGLVPTGRPVTVSGISIFYADTKEFIRSIDWLDTFVQLGYSLRNGRTVIRAGVGESD